MKCLRWIPSIFLGLLPAAVFADEAYDAVTEGLGRAGVEAGYTTAASVTEVIANLIDVILSVTGIAFLVLLVYAGILYMTALGNPNNTQKALKIIYISLAGILLIIGSMALSQFVFGRLEAVI